VPNEIDNKVVLHRLDSIDKTLERITASIDRLVLVEERQARTHEAVERAFRVIEALDGRTQALEKQLPGVSRTSSWMDRTVWAAAVVGVLLILKQAGISW